MKSWIISKLFGFVGKRLDGYKTVIGAVGLILVGVVGIVGRIFPDQGLPVMDVDSAFASIAAGVAALGIGHKAEKVRSAVIDTARSTEVLPAQAPPRDWVPGLCPEEEERAAIEQKPAPSWDGRTPGQFP